jgi:hypothetical protein
MRAQSPGLTLSFVALRRWRFLWQRAAREKNPQKILAPLIASLSPLRVSR